MIVYKCFELHTHTQHSDGSFTFDQLCESVKAARYDGFALTDHNTMSGIPSGPTIVPLIPGIEWTTYYGHMVVLGAERFVDWRFARPDTIDQYTRAIKEARGVIGIAHPFEFGSPVCTGCFWDFKVKDWDNIDYIEVWSNPFPLTRLKNHLAFKWWTELLNQGHRIAATAGTDWHGPNAEPQLASGTYLGLPDGLISTETVKDAISAGRVFVSSGPELDFALSNASATYGLGDTVEPGAYTLSLGVSDGRRRDQWERFNLRPCRIDLVHNGKPIQSLPIDGAYQGACSVELPAGWLRVEVYGQCMDESDKLLLFSSPVYIV